MRALRMQSKLSTESQVFEDEVLAGAKRADEPREEMPERHSLGKNIIGTIRIQFCAKSFILRMYDVLARHNVKKSPRIWAGALSKDRTGCGLNRRADSASELLFQSIL